MFAIMSAVLWGISDFLGGLLSRRVSPVTVIAASQSCGLAVTGAACF
ncbi:MAG: hypothetical protein NTX54_00135 [Chloroflexi bacterium]|nr:hypothetical protein [Chloroflexota bacterium]